jgi:tetratricopeptide (TPR) repeat protein
MSLLIRLAAACLALSTSIAANASWHEAKSNHFIIYADLKPDQIKAYAERLERFDQAVRQVREMSDPKLTDAQRLTVYALRSEGAVARLAGSSFVRGFYRPDASGTVAFVPRYAGAKNIAWDLDAEQIFFHEYAHHLQLEASSAALPPWAVEGFAEFFATAEIEKDGSVVIGNAPQYRAYGLFHRAGLRLEQIVGATYQKLDHEEHDYLYGMGWLLTHYLTFAPARAGQMTRYIANIQKGMNALDAAKAAFGDLKQLDRELEKYKMAKLHGLRVRGDALAVGPIAVRPLTPGEAAIMDVHIRSRRGVNDKTAPGVAAEARKAAAPYAGDPFVQVALAEAEFDAKNYAAAGAAADRALAVNPNYVRALIYKGRAEMEMAKNKAGANWKDIRGWFAKANRLDTENAEPLLLFYQAYGNAGVEPTKISVEGLLYAVALVPQDDLLRVTAVRQLLIDGRLKEARKLFATLAFQPHAPQKYRESNAQIMAAIDADDGKRALAVLEAAMSQADGEEGNR